MSSGHPPGKMSPRALNGTERTLPLAQEHNTSSGSPFREHPTPDSPTAPPRVSGNDDTLAAPENGSASGAPLPQMESAKPWLAAGLPVVEPHNYEVSGEFARGGLGRIVKATDTRLKRPVALKELLRNRGKASARFLREALITAKLQHPNIVPVYEAGCWPDGKPFYAMKMVSGHSLAEVIREKHSLAERLSLLPNVLAVCEAMAYAHGEGVIHRDLKPANVLVGSYGETVVIDWGLAKETGTRDEASLPHPGSQPLATPLPKGEGHAASTRLPHPGLAVGSATPLPLGEGHDARREAREGRERAAVGGEGPGAEAGLTVAGSVMGTVAYMPPEQAYGKPVDARADVYSLGAILYHTLSGAPPYEGKSSAEILQRLISAPPSPLEEKFPEIPQELVTIVKKAMSPEAGERYPTARALAGDLKKFLDGQLVGAHHYTPWELALRFLKRHRAVVGVAAASLLLLAALGLFSFQSIVHERDRAMAAQEKAEVSEASASARADDLTLTQARGALEDDPSAALLWLGRLSSFHRASAARTIAADARSRGVARILRGHGDWVNQAIFSPDGSLLASASMDQTIRLWSAASGEARALFGHTGEVKRLAFSPDGSLLASASMDQTIRLWSVASGEGRALSAHRGGVMSVVFSPDGKTLASADVSGAVRLWDLDKKASRELSGHTDAVWQVAFSPDGTWLASAGADETIRLWNVASGEGRVLSGHTGGVMSVVFSPDGKTLASASLDGTTRLWDLASGKNVLTDEHGAAVWQVVFSGDGKRFASCDRYGAIHLWDLEKNHRTVLAGHRGSAGLLVFSMDGAWLASAGDDDVVHLWNLAAEEAQILRGHKEAVLSLAFSPDGKSLASASKDKTLRLWDLAPLQGSVLSIHINSVWKVLFSPDGRRIASSGRDGLIHLWDFQQNAHQTLRGHMNQVTRTAFSPDGTLLASVSYDKTVRLWNLTTGKNRILGEHEEGGLDIEFTPDGKTLVSVGMEGKVRIWDAATGSVRVFFGHEGAINRLALSPDGAWAATAGTDKTVRLWSLGAKEGEAGQILSKHPDSVLSVAFSPDGQMLASGSKGAIVRLWDLKSGREREFAGHQKQVNRVSFSPDGELLASASNDRTVRLWSVSSGAARVLRGHTGNVWGSVFSPDGRSLVSYSDDGTARLWDVYSDESRALRGHTSTVWNATFSPDGAWVATASGDETVRLWRDDLPKDTAGFFGWLSKNAPSEEALSLQGEAPLPLAPPVDDKEGRQIFIVSSPVPAQLYRVGEAAPLGTTPFWLKVPDSDREIVFVLRATGFEEKILRLRGDDSLREEIRDVLLPQAPGKDNSRPEREANKAGVLTRTDHQSARPAKPPTRPDLQPGPQNNKPDFEPKRPEIDIKPAPKPNEPELQPDFKKAPRGG